MGHTIVHLNSIGYSVGKRLIDLVAGMILLMAGLPIAVVRISCRRTSGPLFLPEQFIGKSGRKLVLFRFNLPRRKGNVETSEPPLITRLPWLVALFNGNLSLVGPRPLPFEATISPAAEARVTVTPGLICNWWLRRRSNINYGSELDADLDYLKQRSLRRDIAIISQALIGLCYGKPSEGCAAAHTISRIPLLNLTMDDLITALICAVKQKTRTQIAFVNPDCVNLAATDPDYRASLKACDWICADGIGMKIAGNLLGKPIRQNINGTDLLPPLCAALATAGHSIYFLGAAEGIAESTAQWARKNYPSLKIAGFHSGYFTPAEEAGIIAEIRAAKADVLLVAMGASRQEPWLQRNLQACGATIGIGVGGLFDFYSGRIRRAPLWLREIGGEWIYRLLQEPGRMWRRYLVGNVVFLVRILIEATAARLGKQVTP